jgi:phospholipid/cholesterol/gamma-HCH transport system substrate-binding protein
MRRKNEVLVGVLLTVAIAIGVLGTIWLVRGGFRKGYPLFATFRWGENLKVGQPVRLAGVQVGYVQNVDLRDDGTLFLTMAIDEGRKVPANALAIVEPVGIFGDAQVALRATPSAQSYAKGDTVPAGSAPPGIAALTAKADSVLAVTVNVSRSLETQLIKEGGIDDVRRTLAMTADLTARLNTVAAEQSRELTLTQRRLRSTLAAIDSGAVDSTLKSLRTATTNLAVLTKDFQATSGRINSILAKVDSGGGSAAMLINDPGLYNDLRRLTTRLDSLTADFKKNPRRYINLEIF